MADEDLQEYVHKGYGTSSPSSTMSGNVLPDWLKERRKRTSMP